MNYHMTESQMADEARCIEKAKQDIQHFGTLYDRYYRRIFLFVYKRVDGEDIAGDLTQQCFLKAMQNLNKFVPQCVPFSAWLYRIAANEVNQYYRRQNARPTESADLAQLAEVLSESQQAYSEENVQRMLDLLKTLPEGDMQLISLRFFEEMSFREVGEICNITENNAKVKVYRILARLRLRLQGGAGLGRGLMGFG